MDRMIERVADRLAEQIGPDVKGTDLRYVDVDQVLNLYEIARAAIEAMREPGVGIMTEEDAAGAFARWIEQGPKLAKAAGCHVGIRVTEGAR